MSEVTRRGVLAGGGAFLASHAMKAQPLTSGATIAVDGNVLLRKGRIYRAVGCNFYDALDHKDLADQFRFLMDNGVPFVRFNFGVYSVGNAPDKGWRQYLSDKRAWFGLRDRCVEAAEAANIGLVANMFWQPYALPGLMKYVYEKEETLAAWGQPDSNTRHFMRDTAAEFADRYKHSPALWGWECSNELSNEIILGCNQPLRFALTNSRLSFDQLSDFYSDWSKAVLAVDSSGRLLSSGDNLGDQNFYGCATNTRLTPDTFTEWMNIPTRGGMLPAPMVLNPPNLNSVSTHIYQHANVPGHWFKGGPQVGPGGLVNLHKEIADKNSRVVFIGEFGSLRGKWGQDGKNGTDASAAGERRYYQTTLDAIVEAQIQLAAVWLYGYLPSTPTRAWIIDPGTERDYMFRSIGEANARIAKQLDEAARKPDDPGAIVGEISRQNSSRE